MNRKSSLIMMVTFLVIIVGLSFGSMLLPDQSFSENENRYLAEAPSFSVKDFMSGKFQKDMENYLNDQICLRNQWITVKTAVQKLCGDTDIGGAYLGSDGYDFEKITPEEVDASLVKRNTQNVVKFFETASEKIAPDRISFLLVPTSGLVLSEKLPKYAVLFDQSAYIDQIGQACAAYHFVDVREVLKQHSEEEIYYRTDHHWTVDGAFLAAQCWNEATGGAVLKKEHFEERTVTEEFRGSLYSKVLDYDSAYDSIRILEPKGDSGEYSVVADGTELEGFYQEEQLSKKDKYAYFFGGNYGEVRIDNKKNQNGKNLLLIKDSFANSFVPLIAGQYDKIYMLDLRYFNQNISEYMEEEQITDILVLYNISNFVSDKNLYKLNRKMLS